MNAHGSTGPGSFTGTFCGNAAGNADRWCLPVSVPAPVEPFTSASAGEGYSHSSFTTYLFKFCAAT